MTANKRKKYTLQIIWFTILGSILIWLVDGAIQIAVRHSDSEQTGKVNKVMGHEIDPGIMVFGSSVGEVGIDAPEIASITNQSVYNCCIDGTRYMQYRGIIDEFDSYSKNNKYVVMVESYLSFEKIQAVNSLDRYLAYLNNGNLYNSLYAMQPDLLWKCRYVPFYKFIPASHVYYKNAAVGLKRLMHHSKDTDSLMGYTPAYKTLDPDLDSLIKNTPHFDVAIDSAVVGNYIQTIEKLQRSGRKVVLILPPVLNKVIKQVTDLGPLRNTLTKIAQQTGSVFYDFSNSAICDRRDLFYNRTHLNATGSAFFSKQLADSMLTIMNAPIANGTQLSNAAVSQEK